MTEEIKKYLDGQAKRDATLKAKYNPSLMDKCVDYINKQARETLKGRSGHINDEVVYKWARDYFIEDIAAKEAKEAAKREEERKKKAEQTKKDAAKEKKPANKSVAEKPSRTKSSDKSDKTDAKPAATKPSSASATKRRAKTQQWQKSLFDFGDECA